eukprot:c5703_g1_i3.p2 GENE.c5703_g1_i3~~c5703_g1_i3.p2  ORF type:complete len:175 (+),score=43.63 c5703_g1_i3:48-572(+)
MSGSIGFSVKYSVEDCPPKGKGVVARQFIPKGALVWNGDVPGAVECFTEQEIRDRIATMDAKDAGYLLNHIYCYQGQCMECDGDAKLVNHSADPTTAGMEILGKEGTTPLRINPDGTTEPFDVIPLNANFARRDIQEGEELTDDYSFYENPEWYVNLCKQYNVEHAGLVAELYK